MKIWKSLLVIFVTSLLGWGGYEFYQKFILSNEINSLELISEDAIFTFETYQADQAWNALVDQPIWKHLSQFPAFESFSSQLTSLDSLLGSNGFLSKKLRSKQVTVSYHTTGADSFSLLYTMNFGNENPAQLLQDLKSKISSSAKFQTRKYSDQEIIEYIDSSNTRKWSITILNKVLLVSSSSFVIEEAIRFFLNDGPDQISDKLGSQLAYDSDLGRLILTSRGLSKLISGVRESRESALLNQINSSDHVVALNLTFEDKKLIFKGPIKLDFTGNFLPSLQAKLEDFEKLISRRTQSITQINLGGIYETQKLKNQAFSPISTLSGEIQSRLIERGFLDYFSGEMYLLDLETQPNEEGNKALLIRTLQPEQVRDFLKEFRGDADFQSVDYYSENEILFFPENEFPAHLFEGKFTGFDQTHISFVGDILIMTNSAQGMKWILDGYSMDSNWKQQFSGIQNQIISPSSGYSKTFILPRILNRWIQESNPVWSTFFQKFKTELQAFPIVTFKINQFPSGQEASLIFHYLLEIPTEKVDDQSFELVSGKQINLPKRIIYGPKIIKNFNDNTEDLIVQDESHTLYLINSAGEQVYSQQLGSPVISETYQIDFYKNGKLQVLLATADQLHAIDRLGNSLPGFPFSIPNEKIANLNLVDYDKKKEYRYFVSTVKGSLWLFDKTGKSLEGWSPLNLGEQTIGAPLHTRIPGKGDFMVAYGKSGKVYAFNRRGETQPGFPLDLGKDITYPILITSAKNTSLTAISKGGEVINGSFSGEILNKKQVIKTYKDDLFGLLPDQNSEGYMIRVKQFNKTLILNQQLETLMTLPIMGERSWFKYFDFGDGRKYVAATDPEQGFGYLHDLKGNLMTTVPLESDGEIEISHYSKLGQLIIRTRSGERILEYIIPD